MYFEKVKVINEMGIHAKIASSIIKITTKCKANIFFEHNNKMINAKSIVAILASRIRHMDEIRILTDSDVGINAVKELVRLIENDI